MTRKIKIVELTSVYSHEEYPINEMVGATEWEEVDEETYKALQYWVVNQPYNQWKKIVLIEEAILDKPKIVADYLEIAIKQNEKTMAKERKQQEKEEKKRKREEKQREKLRQKKEAKEKAMLEELKKKYES